jgi:hypothetical protein
MELENRTRANSIFEDTRKEILEDLSQIKAHFSETLSQSRKVGQNPTLTQMTEANGAQIETSILEVEKESLKFVESVKKFRSTVKFNTNLLAVTVQFNILELSSTHLEGQIVALQATIAATRGTDQTVTDAQILEVSAPLNAALDSLKNLKKDTNFMLKSSVDGQKKR